MGFVLERISIRGQIDFFTSFATGIEMEILQCAIVSFLFFFVQKVLIALCRLE